MHNTTHQHGSHLAAPITHGRLIRWARPYDMAVKLMLLGQEGRLRENTLRRAALQPGSTVLDVGCGTGTLTLRAKQHVGSTGRVYGIDASPEMIAVAQHKAADQSRDVNFQIGLIEALPFEDASFDVVLSSLMFHHLPPDLKPQALTEIHRVLKPGGRLLIADMKRPTTFGQHIAMTLLVHHAPQQGVYEIQPLMKEAGYTAIQTGDLFWGIIGFIQGQRPT